MNSIGKLAYFYKYEIKDFGDVRYPARKPDVLNVNLQPNYSRWRRLFRTVELGCLNR